MRRAVIAIFVAALSVPSAACSSERSSHDWRDGYALAYLTETGNAIEIRASTDSGWETTATVDTLTNSGGLLGVALGRRLGSPSTLLAYTADGTLSVREGIGFIFDASTNDELTGVATAPAIVHIGGDHWLVAYATSAGRIDLRPYEAGSAGGFGALLDLTAATSGNSDVSGRPAIAYFDGRLVAVWPRFRRNQPLAFGYLAAKYEPGAASVEVVATGDIPSTTYKSELASGPFLTHDGDGTFYLATVQRSGYTGLSHDTVFVHSSLDGMAWDLAPRPGLPAFTTASTRAAIAASPSGEVLLAVIDNHNNRGLLYKLQEQTWEQLSSSGFGQGADVFAEFWLTRHQFLETTATAPVPITPPPTPAAKLVAFSSSDDHNTSLFTVATDGSGLQRLTDPAYSSSGAAWSPDGSSVAFTTWRDGNAEVYVMEADGSDQRNLTMHASSDHSPAWSPDGSRIAFVSYRDGNDEIYVMNADGTGQTRLTSATAPLGSTGPRWSPDGTRILFTRNDIATDTPEFRSYSGEIYVMDADGANLTNLTDLQPQDDCCGQWSPDGARILFVADSEGHWSDADVHWWTEVFVMNVDGSGKVNLTNDPGADENAVWSPDGTRLAFDSSRNLNYDIFVMNADGTGVRQVTTDPADDRYPVWSPDGQSIAFITERATSNREEVFVMDADGGNLSNLSTSPNRDLGAVWQP